MPHLDEGALHALVDGEIPSDELEPVRAHLATCAACQARLDEARAMSGEADQLVSWIEVPDLERTDGFGGGQAGRRAGGRWWMRPRSLAWAASIIVAAGLGYLGGREQQPRPAAPSSDFAPQLGPEQQTATPLDGRAVEAIDQLAQESERQTKPQVGGLVAGREERSGERGQTGADLAAPAERSAAAPAEGNLRDNRVATKVATGAAARPTVGRVDSVAVSKTLAEEPKRERADEAAAPPATPAPMSATEALERAGEVRRRVAAQRLEQARPESQFRALGLRNEAEFITVSFTDGLRLLGGQLRLVDGLVPERVEAAGAVVRVVYRLADGELLLEQRREGDSVAVVRLSAPPSIGSDSLARLWARIR